MGYCTYTLNKNTGGAVAAWIGTGTDLGKQVTVSYNKGATNKTAACNDVRNQFCKKYGVSGKCFSASNNTSPRVATPQQGCSLIDAARGLCTYPDIANYERPGTSSGSTGSTGSTTSTGPGGVDSDCEGYWLGKEACIAGKSFLKGLQGVAGGFGLGAQYVLPILAVGGVVLAFIILKR